ncbi:MAG: oxidoreductase [Candidatus Sericytochromatia bacterium]|nr:oxidoreductase [Candidatus Sericytochromatia bacterium]
MTPETDHVLTVTRRWPAAEGHVGLTLRPEDPSYMAAHRVSGQYLVLRGEPEAPPVFLALAAAPGRPEAELLIRTGVGGPADALAAREPGARVLGALPAGPGFPVEGLAGRDVVLAAAGSGIAPIRAVIQQVLADRGRYGRITLYWGVLSQAHVPYADELEAWRAGGIDTQLVIGQAPSGEPGRRVQDVLASASLSPANTSALLCGMRPMVEAVREVLVGRGISPSSIHLNH